MSMEFSEESGEPLIPDDGPDHAHKHHDHAGDDVLAIPVIVGTAQRPQRARALQPVPWHEAEDQWEPEGDHENRPGGLVLRDEPPEQQRVGERH